MKALKVQTTIFGENCNLEVMEFDKEDGREWKKNFDLWKGLKLGMRSYKSREPNFPEGLSESAFCIFSGSVRLLKAKGLSNTSFDTLNLGTKRAEQVKACSIEKDLTSFGPRSRWDDLYFLDFFAGGKVDGTFDIYKIPNNFIYGVQVNKGQTLKDQQGEKRRPRFSIKKNLVLTGKIKPLKTSVKVW